jgi:hypothetical protein
LACGKVDVEGMLMLIFEKVERRAPAVDGGRAILIHPSAFEIFFHKLIPRKKGHSAHDGLCRQEKRAA